MIATNPLAVTETEEFFLSALLYHPEDIAAVTSILQPEDFASRRNEALFAAMLEMVAKGQIVAVDTLEGHLAASGRLGEAGGRDYLFDLAILAQGGAYQLTEQRAKAIQEAALRRYMRRDAMRILEAAQDPERPIEELAGMAQAAALLTSQRRGGEGPVRLDSLLPAAAKLLEAQSKGEVTGLKTGFYDLDAFTGGFQRTDYVVLGGRPGMGKTVLAANIAAHVAIDQRKPVLFCELEMGKLQIVNRILFSRAEVNGRLLRTGRLASRDYPKLAAAVEPIKGAPFFLDGQVGVTPLQLLSKARQIKMQEGGLDLIVVDNIQIMRGDGKYGGNKRLEISDVSNNLKRIAKEMDCTLLAISHLSRECERRGDPEPTLSDLKETGDIEQDADMVMLLYREEVYKEVPPDKQGETKVIFAKFREGETVAKLLRFLPEYNKFTSWSPRQDSPADNRRDTRKEFYGD